MEHKRSKQKGRAFNHRNDYKESSEILKYHMFEISSTDVFNNRIFWHNQGP